MEFLRRLFFLSIKIIFTLWLSTTLVIADESPKEWMSQFNVLGSVKGQKIRQLSLQEFERFNLNKSGMMGTWQGLISQLQSNNPLVHIIDAEFYSNPNMLGFRSRYGTHEAYARFNGLAKNSADFLKNVLSRGEGKNLMPFTLHISAGGLANLNGKPVHWIFQNRRYKYIDKSDGFVKALMKSQQAVSDHLFPLMGSSFKTTFITYQKRKSFQRPNMRTINGQKDIALLKKLGFNVILESDIEVLSGKVKQQITVLNLGSMVEGKHFVSYGFLRHITDNTDDGKGEGSINQLTVKDFAIFDELPERVSPVAGIIVLEKQTEFSHINLLAKNRGMMNISLSNGSEEIATNQFLTSTVKGFSQALFGQAVKVEVNDRNVITISLSTKQKVDQFYAKQRKRWGSVKIQAPMIVDDKRWLLNPAKEKLAVDQVGAKAANYGLIQNRLKDSGLVLPGRAIGFNLYLKTLELEGALGKPQDLVQQLIREKNNLSLQETNKKLKEIQEAILAIPYKKIPKTITGVSIVDEITELFNTADYKDVGRIRFRSSTNCEDLPSFNGAGLYQSKGFTVMRRDAHGRRIVNGKKMWKKLKKVMASLWLSRAFHEREYFGIDHQKVAMAIQINPAFSNKWLNGVAMYEWGNGVILYNEKKGKQWLKINSQIGESSVSNPLNGALPESLSFINGKLETIERRAEIKGKQHVVFLAKNKNIISAKSRILLEKLMSGVKDIYTMMVLESANKSKNKADRYAIDIEYKIMFDKVKKAKSVYIKQARLLFLETEK